MATFIPEWARATAREMQLRRTLGALDDDHVVRRPVRPGTCAADFFVQHPARGWSAVSVSGVAFAELDPTQLFASEQRVQFEQRLVQLQRLADPPGQARRGLSSVMVLWTCSTEEVGIVSAPYLERYGTRLVSRAQWEKLGAGAVGGLLTPISQEHEQGLLAAHFPEAEIPAACTTRRAFRRDNRARLGRFFLDPEQEWAAKVDLEMLPEQADAARDFSVRLINGVAGSGKTLIAINRALLLAELFPRQRILFLIHNTPIVADLKERLHRVRGGLPANLEIQTFFAWAGSQWRRAFDTPANMPEDPRAVADLVRQHRTRWPGLRQSDAQLTSELDFINDALIRDLAAYMGAGRAGRGFALRPPERVDRWALYEAVTGSLRRSGLQPWSAMPRTLCLTEQGHPSLRRYDHVIVDEAQFFAPSWFELVKLSLAPRGQLFLCADPNQGFMKNRLSWKSAGLDVAGRTKKLRRSYRTTRAILESATGVLALLGRGDDEEGLDPDFADMEQGTTPTLIYADAPQDALDRLVNELAALAADRRVSLGSFLVIYGDNVHRQHLYAELGRRFGADNVWWLNKRGQKQQPPQGYGKDYLRMAYIDSATGLEAHVVFLIGIEGLLFSGRVVGLNDDEQEERRIENARKLYMAMTRAGRALVVLSSQRLSGEMEALFDRENF
jgi:hypothetical protein